MNHTKQMVVALVAAFGLVGSVPASTQAIDPDCSADYTIPILEPLLNRNLAKDASEVGSIVVSEETDVRVKLPVDDAVLAFGVFVEVGQQCDVASEHMDSSCGDHIVLDTTTVANTTAQWDCTLKPDGSTPVTYYFRFLNSGDDSLGYKSWKL